MQEFKICIIKIGYIPKSLGFFLIYIIACGVIWIAFKFFFSS